MNFDFEPIRNVWGFEAKRVTGTTFSNPKSGNDPLAGLTLARSAFGRAVVVDPRQFDIQVFPFFDLINANFGKNPTVGFCPEPHFSLGATVKDFIEGSRRETIRGVVRNGNYVNGGVFELESRRCVYAMNALHTNFVRPNGFIIRNFEVISKPVKYDALGLDCGEFMSLAGPHTALVLDDGTATIETLNFSNGMLTTNAPKFAVSGPALLDNGNIIDIPYRPTGPTHNDEVNYPPQSTMTSFSAIGITGDQQLVFVSMFEELRGQGNGYGQGITVYEMAELLLQLGTQNAIVGGGSADTQQFLRGDYPQFLTAPARARSPGQAPRSEVEGPRGLGAILCVLIRV